MSRMVRAVALAIAVALIATPVAALAEQRIGISGISIPQLEESGTPTETATPTETPTPALEPPTETPRPTDTPAPTELELLQALIDQVNSFAAGGDIDGNMVNCLMSQLRAALASLERGNVNSARGQLGAFINHVEAQRGKKIGEAAAELIAQAQSILTGFWWFPRPRRESDPQQSAPRAGITRAGHWSFQRKVRHGDGLRTFVPRRMEYACAKASDTTQLAV